MKAKRNEPPLAREALGDMIRASDWGGMNAALMSFPAGTDFCPLLEGLKNDHCQCPHWGYLVEGRIRVTYEDGTTETVEAGEIYYWPPGHTILIEETTLQAEFSPAREMEAVLDHVVGRMAALQDA
jgi:ethanolamine utilization protein EutQ (cupin superfamily)